MKVQSEHRPAVRQNPNPISTIRVDRKIWTGRALSRLIVYAVDVAHVVLAVEPVGEYERTALFKENARVSTNDGEYWWSSPGRSTISTISTKLTTQ